MGATVVQKRADGSGRRSRTPVGPGGGSRVGEPGLVVRENSDVIFSPAGTGGGSRVGEPGLVMRENVMQENNEATFTPAGTEAPTVRLTVETFVIDDEAPAVDEWIDTPNPWLLEVEFLMTDDARLG